MDRETQGYGPDNHILWVGPGMGDLMRLGPWPKAFRALMHNDKDPLKISAIKYLDITGKPKLFFGKNYAFDRNITQMAERGDFFQEGGHRLNCDEGIWDIIILDFIEAWLLGRHYWPTLSETPYELILREWELKLKHLHPYQVWVVHDADTHSTIMPRLDPEYKIVVNSQPLWFGYRPKEQDIQINRDASYWTPQAAEPFRYLHVWQLI
jgi:hypothetical protein